MPTSKILSLNEIESYAESFLQDPKKIRCLQKIIDFKTEVASERFTQLKTIRRCITSLSKKRLLSTSEKDIESDILTPKDAYSAASRQCFEEAVSAALESLKFVDSSSERNQTRLREYASECLIEFVRMDYIGSGVEQRLVQYYVHSTFQDSEQGVYSQSRFERLNDNGARMKSITRSLRDQLLKEDVLREDVSTEKLVSLLRTMTSSLSADDNQSKREDSPRQHLATLWLAVLRRPLTPTLRRQLLAMAVDHILPLCPNPHCLAGFFMGAFSDGGITAMFSLYGMFNLMTKHHLDYPDFYSKLYSILQPPLLDQQRHRARFFELLSLFLSSTHLPLALVASFAKRLSRLTLSASPDALFALIPFIGDLLIRHRKLELLVHHAAVSSLATDPYDEMETDPVKSGAIESSLWELQAIRTHALPAISTLADWIERPLPRMEWDLKQRLKTDPQHVFDRTLPKDKGDLRLTLEEVPVNFYAPKTPFDGVDGVEL